MNKLVIALLSMVIFLQYHLNFQPGNPVSHLQEISVTIKKGQFTGSGVIKIHKGQAYVWTVNHIFESKTPNDSPIEIIKYTYNNGVNTGMLYFLADIVDRSEKYDLAVLKVKKNHYFKYSVSLYTEDNVPALGETIWGVSSPYGESNHNTTVKGIIAQHDRLTYNNVTDQIDCAVSPGSSGGGIFLNDGRLIGLIKAKRDDTMGYIIPIRKMIEWAKTTNLPKGLYE